MTSRPRVVLACVSTCTLLVVGLVAAINLAVPQLAASPLHPSGDGLLWIVDAYVLVFACLVIPGGAVGDRLGRRGVLVAGLGLFAVGAVVSAVAPSVPVLLVGRVVTGVGAAAVLPNCLGVLTAATPLERRRSAIAVWATATGLGGLVGNIGGGLLLTAGTWRTLFGAAAALAAACAGWVLLAARPSPRAARRLDPIGAALLVAAAVAVVGAIIEAPELGWTSPVVLGAIVAGVVLAAVWVLVELRVAHPLLDPRLFRVPAVAAASLGMIVTFFGSFGLFYVNASLFQYGRGWSALGAGLAILPLTLPILVGARLTPRIAARLGATAVQAIAFAAIGAGLLGLAATADAAYPWYAVWLVVVGEGFALALPTLTVELASALPPERAGVAGGLQAATRELGSALGVAVVGSVLAGAFVSALPRATAGSRTVAQALAADPRQHAAVVAAFTSGVSVALVVAAIVLLAAGALVTGLAVRGRPAARRSEGRQARA